jgi:hypothetical protein
VAVLESEKSGNVEVLSPFQKQMKCLVSDFTNGSEIVKGFVCGGEGELPDLLIINEKTKKAMIEVVDQPHYDLDCEIK